MTHANHTLWFVYDGQCPLCHCAATAYRVRQAVGKLETIDARREHEHPILKDIQRKGPDIDRGHVIAWNGKYYQGDEALYLMAKLGATRGWFNKLTVSVFRIRWIASWTYPSLRACRNILLAIKGIRPINGSRYE